MENRFCEMLKNELKNNKKYGPLTLEKEIELGKAGNINAIWEHNMRFALKMVKEFKDKYEQLFYDGVLKEQEVTSAAYIGLGEACYKWNPEKGCKVNTLAGWHITKAMNDYLVKAVKRVQTFKGYDEEESRAKREQKETMMEYGGSLYNTIDGDKSEDTSEELGNDFVAEIDAHYASDALSNKRDIDESILVPEAIDENLNEKEALIVKQSLGICGYPKLQKQAIAAQLHVSTEAVRCTYKKALEKLRNNQKLRDYYYLQAA